MKLKKISEFYKTFIFLGIPLVVQQFITSSLNFIDNLMIGRLGTHYIAAVGFANSIYRIYDLFLFGLYSGMGIFIAQYYGKKDYATIKKIFGKMVKNGLILGTSFTTIVYLFGEKIMGIYTKDPVVLQISLSYIKLAVFSYIFYALSFSISYSCRSMGKTKVSMIASATGVSINTIFNYMLIYGNFGMPKLAEKGAAIATIIARIFELCIFVLVIYLKDYHLKGNLNSYLNLSKKLIKEIYKKSIPVFFTEAMWILGTISLTVAYARLGTIQAAAVQISDIVMAIGAIIFMGVSNSSAIIIGHTIGQGDFDKVISYSKKIIKISAIMALIAGIFIEISTPTIVNLYKLDPIVHDLAIKVMRVAGGFVFFKMICWSILIGLFRAGGDTRVAFFLDTLPNWLYSIPVAFTGAYLKVSVYKLMIIVELAEIIKFIFAYYRYKSLKWIKDVTVKE
ncbi:MAG: MATE family efflux transporter [Fusobacteriaceae bacterium]|jgi:putative MATE family efflux protein|nr:MATE family efflux transporter [Fusobacteriaceae bacterium]